MRVLETSVTEPKIIDRSRAAVTLHLVPEPVWRDHADAVAYLPEDFAAEGFAHCTDSESSVIEVANRYYRGDTQPYLVLDVDLVRVAAKAVYEDSEGLFPRIYGPIEREAVVRVRRVGRAGDGTFTRIEGAMP